MRKFYAERELFARVICAEGLDMVVLTKARCVECFT